MVAKITLPNDIAETVLHLVSDGEYPDSDAVIRRAFDLFERQRESARLWQSIHDADRSIDEGHGIPYEEVALESIQRGAREKRERGEAPDPDVLP